MSNTVTKSKGLGKSGRERVGYWVRTVIILALALICAIPLWYVVINTFKTSKDMMAHPLALPEGAWQFGNYVTAFQNLPLVQAFGNTLYVTILGVAFQVFIGSLAAYGMIIRNSRFTAVIGAILMIAFVIPAQATLIPLYRMEAQTGLVNTLTGLVVLYLGGSVFCYFLIVGYMRKLPFELVEAARIDGAGPFRIYWTIILPLIRPILTTVVVFQTLSTWNDFMNPNVFLSSGDKKTIVLQVYNAVGEFSTDWTTFMTITVISLIPVVVFFVFCQKWIVAGLAAGAVKG
ncbi:ABC transporter, permease protein [Bifidobacterium ramosum]|uniref:ABC transporter permease subunit n=1 Tax=Bifidobacterium ramosum TaxID=1798158 RepID=A0A6L4WYP9_9BIFI|nr:carbohydrate ABC transporter permease [Bifidobacterium ramosum]KAB8287234.1 ABC transporter, permease protein [Bifidobacterium ramosum]NEG71944.1 ABC transporter permease subunit [Bifidobacterium ramosum]